MKKHLFLVIFVLLNLILLNVQSETMQDDIRQLQAEVNRLNGQEGMPDGNSKK